MAVSVHVVATGARTPVGLNSASAAVAVRAGITALGQHPFMIDQVGDPMPGALDAQLDPALFGPKRLLTMAESALREACTPLSTCAHILRQRVPMYLGLPEPRPGFSSQDAEKIRSGLMALQGLPVDLSDVKIFTEGHAAGLSALAVATEQIKRGYQEACLVGGVDSYFHPDTMEWLDKNRQLAGTVSRSGFVPGEGAGFCLLVAGHAWKRLDLNSLAHVIATATGRETKLIKTSDICLGEGLTATVQGVVNKLSPPRETVNDIICDINGERYRGEEWGFTCLRLPQHFDDPTTYSSPATCWGDIGAASGPLFAMLACQAAVNGYAKGPRTLLWASSEGGWRAAAVLGIKPMERYARGGDNHV